MSDATFYTWKSKYGGIKVSEAKRLRPLEGENAKLKRLLADAMLDNAALKELLGKNGDARCWPRGGGSSADLQGEFAMSKRWACRVVAVDRSSVRYTAGGAARRRSAARAAVRRRLRSAGALANETLVAAAAGKLPRQPQANLPAVQARAVDAADANAPLGFARRCR